MSTNSLVAYLSNDGTVTTSYVHWDGNTTSVGWTLLEHYNTEEKAKELATTLGYASSLYETIEKSHEDRANTDEAIVYENYLDFEDYIRESSFLEYVYIWVEHRNEWQVATWEHTKLDTISDEGLEFRYDWNGFGKLTDVFTNEAVESIKRFRDLADKGNTDYLGYAEELEAGILKYAIEETTYA